MSLQVQGGTVIVDVTGEAPVVNTQDATLGNNFNARQLTDLPTEGRDPVSILSLQPGVVYIGKTTVNQDDDSRGGAVNGARSDQTNVTLDGLDDNDQLKGYAFKARCAPPSTPCRNSASLPATTMRPRAVLPARRSIL